MAFPPEALLFTVRQGNLPVLAVLIYQHQGLLNIAMTRWDAHKFNYPF